MNVQEYSPKLQPRERILERGAEALSDHELMCLIIGNGNRQKPVKQLSQEVLKYLETKNFCMDSSSLMQISGLGVAKAGLICAAFELARRVHLPSKQKITSPSDILPLIRHYADRQQEYFLAVTLNGAHEAMKVRVVSIGLLNRTMVHPREVFAQAISDRAAAVLVAHNHPSGDVRPSPEDKDVTLRLRQAGEILGISLLDHLVFTESGYYSFMEDGAL